MYITGINYSTNSNGQKVTTLQVTEPFEPYYTNTESGRGCVGEKAESIYVGDYDCSKLEVGMEIENNKERTDLYVKYCDFSH